MQEDFNQKQLVNAIKYLYGKGLIKKDKDIADKTGYNKATVSSYISGKITPSKDFIQAFQQAFLIRLEDFREGGINDNITVSDPIQLLSERLIQILGISRVNQSLLTEILAHQTGKTVMGSEQCSIDAPFRYRVKQTSFKTLLF